MTIASEITRLQNDKAAICTAIENKGVTVGNVTLDDYACCIDAIEQGGGEYCLEALIVGGGGGGGGGGCGYYYGGSGGGAGGVIEFVRGNPLKTQETALRVIVGSGGCGGGCYCDGCKGGSSVLGNCEALGGGGGGGGILSIIHTFGGSNGGCARCGCFLIDPSQGNLGGFRANYPCCSGVINAGGGGYGDGGHYGGLPACFSCYCGFGNGGYGIQSCIKGVCMSIAGGGGGGGTGGFGCGMCGGGNGGCGGTNGCNATTYGSGGGGAGGKIACGGNGCKGIVIVRYPTDGSYGFTCATGGTVTTITQGGVSYKVHTFTLDGTFIINPSGRYLSYLVVGGGGGGAPGGYNTGGGGGGGGAVCFGVMKATEDSYSVVVGAGGCGCCGTANGQGGYSQFGDIRAVGGKKGCIGTAKAGTKDGGTSGNDNPGGKGGNKSCNRCGGGGGGGARGMGGDFNHICGVAGNVCAGGMGGRGFMGYGGGGGGGEYGGSYAYGLDGGGDGSCAYAAATNDGKNCGGGGGGTTFGTYAGKGACGVVDICYPSDGSYGFTCATGGTKSLINGYCRHRFTSNGTFTIVS